MKRGGRIRPKPLDEDEKARRYLVRHDMQMRDGGCVLRDYAPAGSCFGPPTPHHLWKAGQGGLYELSHLVTLCSSHNDGWVESHPDDAHALGLVVRYGETVIEAWDRLLAAGLVTTTPIFGDDDRRIRR